MHDLLQLMYQDGFLSSTELVALRKTCRELKESPVRVLRSLNVASSAEVQGFLQRFYGCAAVTDTLVEHLDESYKALIPVDIALNYSVFALAEEDSKLFVAMEDPTDPRILTQLEFFLDRKISPCVATVHQLARGLSLLYGFDVSQLKLSSVLEASRGVVGGKIYDDTPATVQMHEEKSELLLDECGGHSFDFSGAALEEVANLPSAAAPVFDGFGDDVGESASSGLGMLKSMDPELAGATVADLDSFEPDLGESVAADVFAAPPAQQGPMDIDALLAANDADVDALLNAHQDEKLPAEEILRDEFLMDELTSEEMTPTEIAESEITAPVTAPLPPEFLLRVSAVVNATLVRLSLQREKFAALQKLNQSLAPLEISISETQGAFSIEFDQTQYEFNPAEEVYSPLTKVLAPALKKIALLA